MRDIDDPFERQGRTQLTHHALDLLRGDRESARDIRMHEIMDPRSPDGSETSGSLAWFATQGDLASLRALLAASPAADLDAHGRLFQIPLHAACQASAHECVEELLNSGANPVLRDKMGRSPMDMAATPPRWLRNPRADAGRTIQLLAAAGAPIDEPDAQGFTPLLLACDSGAREAAMALHALGADLWARTHDGLDAFELCRAAAAQCGADAHSLADWLRAVKEREELEALPLVEEQAANASRAKSL